MNARRFTFIASLMVLLIFTGLNIAVQNWMSGVRADMTENKLYTLSEAARDIASNLAEPVELQFIYSRRLAADYPAIRAYGARVRELLAEISAQSEGDVIVTVIDPDPFTDSEERVLDAGLSATPTDGGEPLYFGIIGRNSVDDRVVIPYLAPEREALLEYDLVKLISQLDDPSPPRIGVLSELTKLQGVGDNPADFYVLKELARSVEIVPIRPNFVAIPDDLDALVIAHPPKLTPRQEYLIEQFLLRNGRALIALDPASKSAVAARGRRALLSSSLGQIEAMLGLGPLDGVVIDKEIGLPVERVESSRRIVEAQPLFIAPTPLNMSQTDPITTDLTRAINFGAAGRLAVSPPPGAIFEDLVWTTENAALTSIQQAGRETSPREFLADYTPLGQRQVLAGRLTGMLTSAYTPDTIPPVVLPSDPVRAALARRELNDLPHVSKSLQPADIILISDADIFDDSFYVSPNGGAPVAENAAFILNAIDNLSGSQALVRLRSRAPSARPMLLVDAMRDMARERLYEEQEILEAQLKATEARLTTLREAGAGGGLLASGGNVSQTEATELSRFRAEAADIRQRLREIEREFRVDIDKLHDRLVLINVWIPPVIVIIVGFLIVGWRNRSKGRRR